MWKLPKIFNKKTRQIHSLQKADNTHTTDLQETTDHLAATFQKQFTPLHVSYTETQTLINQSLHEIEQTNTNLEIPPLLKPLKVCKLISEMPNIKYPFPDEILKLHT